MEVKPMSEARAEPHLFVVMGGSGDLMRRKLLPTLYRLQARGPLQGKTFLMGVGRREMTDDAYRSWAADALASADVPPGAGAPADWCNERLYYRSVHGGTVDDYRQLANELAGLERKRNLPGNRVLYLALPPVALRDAIRSLGEGGLTKSPGWTRLVVEKPFGCDLQSAEEINALILRYATESQVYRTDHYLAKEAVQNLMVFRFANAIFESLWNRDRIDNVQITVAESVGVSTRAEYYDEAGALRDMVQNHLTQLLTLTAMEIPAALESGMIHDEKVKVLRSVAPIGPGDAVFGQYTGSVVHGEELRGYCEEGGVAPDSQTETFVALRMYVNNWRWQGVPFFLRTGKRLPIRTTQIVVNFKCPVLACFAPFSCDIHCNRLVMMLDPNEGFDLCFEVKAPGQPFLLKTERLSFRYADAFDYLPEAYETVLLDLVRGDQTLFVRADAVEAAWALYEPILKRRPPMHLYPAGSWGPEEVANLLQGRDWDVSPC
jgi:glucose-6-phosphate 1-dehydrogenase